MSVATIMKIWETICLIQLIEESTKYTKGVRYGRFLCIHIHLLVNVYLCCHEFLVYKYTGCNKLQKLCQATRVICIKHAGKTTNILLLTYIAVVIF